MRSCYYFVKSGRHGRLSAVLAALLLAHLSLLALPLPRLGNLPLPNHRQPLPPSNKPATSTASTSLASATGGSTILTFYQMVDVGKDNKALSRSSSSLLVPPLEGAHTTDTLGELNFTFLRLDHNMASGFPSKINISRPALLAGGRLNLFRKLPACKTARRV